MSLALIRAVGDRATCSAESLAMPDLRSIEVKAFVPARDFELSKRFYRDLGFAVAWSSEDLAYLRHGETAFLLQNFYQPEHAGNFMMHLLVADVDAWWRHVEASGLVAKYNTRAEPPSDKPWGMRDFVLIDPTGVLWRIGQNIGGP
jgi:catechol 2,3-dioxygenase-like lactoylglutathione lyase family enzyme